MKAALILTGNIRTFEQCIQSFEQLISKYDLDIFICTSNIQNDLHPFIKEKYNYYNECILSHEQIHMKLAISELFYSKIKKVIILDKIEEDNFITENYLHKFDKTKGWSGIDIFKQYHKIKLCSDYIQEYQLTNHIKYDYLIKSRFDLNINITNFPSYPLAENSFYTLYNGGSNHIQDHILITNNINNFNKLTNAIIQNFMHNVNSTSIHTILLHIFTINGLNNIQTITNCEINRNYNLLFNTNTTLVTCFYNINRDKWTHSQRNMDKYFENCEHVLNKLTPIVIFTTIEFNERILNIRKKTDKNMVYTKIINIPFEQLKYYDKLDLIKTVQIQNNPNIYPKHGNTNPEFVIPEYVMLISNKVHFMKRVASDNIWNSNIFQWVDFGLHTNVFNSNYDFFNPQFFNNIFYKSNKIRLTGFLNSNTTINKRQLFNSNIHTVCAGYLAGDSSIINKLCELCEFEFNSMLNDGLVNQEQCIYYYLLCKYPELFDYSITDTWDNLSKNYFKNTIKIAICMSGHIRTYNLCKDNLYKNIIQPLENNGFCVNTFLSSWNDYGFREDNFQTKKITDFNSSDFTAVHFENMKPEFFIANYSSNNYKNYPGLCGDRTCSDASSMLYKISDSYTIMNEYSSKNNIQYDIIIRLRPDLIFNNNIDISSIKECLFNNNLYMPLSHGNYTSVTKNIMDHYFFGNNSIMKTVMNTFENLHNLMKLDCPHCGEGFLWKQIEENNIIIKRISCSYGYIRKDQQIINILY